MNITIKSVEDVRGAVALLTANVNNMCNVQTTEEVSQKFVEAKDILISIFKFNVERTSDQK